MRQLNLDGTPYVPPQQPPAPAAPAAAAVAQQAGVQDALGAGQGQEVAASA